jgi:N-acetyl-anhydromuramyl-L-alanine amidase AmpD
MRIKTLKYFTAISMVAFVSFSPVLMAMDEVQGIEARPSQNHRSRNGKPIKVLDIVCVGYSDEWVFDNYGCNGHKGLDVSSHYYISKDGRGYEFAHEGQSTYHAGISEWRSLAQENALKGLNDASIGVLFQSPGYALIDEKPYHPFSFSAYSEEQINTGINLCKQIMERHAISAENVVWHSDIAPTRKTDPGPYFPGKRFAQQGVGVWPSTEYSNDSQPNTSLQAIRAGLKKWGYSGIENEQLALFDKPTKFALQAYYMHYLSDQVNWGDYTTLPEGSSIFDTVEGWESFPYNKETLAITLENLNNGKYAF